MKITVLGAVLILMGVILLVLLVRSKSPEPPPNEDSGEADITPDWG
jgi:hypothetical protein